MKKAPQLLRLPKTIALLRLLCDNEHLGLKQTLVRQKKLRSLILLENLWKNKAENFTTPFKKSLFKQLFSEEYSNKKDYLLRNEFRLLNQYIEDHLVLQELENEVENNQNAYNYYLLRALQDRKALKLFEKEYHKAYDHALEHADYYAAHNIAGLNFVNYTQFLNLKEKDLDYLKKLNDLKLTHLSAYYLTAFRMHQINSEYTRNAFYPFSIHDTLPSKEVKVDFEAYENDYSGYLYTKAKSFVVPLKQRIVLLESCLAYAREHQEKSIIFARELRFCLSMLAKLHSVNFEFEKAAEYFEAFFQLPIEKDDPQRLSVLCDYIAKLILLDQIDKALPLIMENKAEINKIEKLQVRLTCLEIACTALAGMHQNLYPLLPTSFKDYSKDLKNFFRFYYSIYAYCKNDIEEAYREILNLDNSNRSHDSGFDIRLILKLFKRFYYIELSFLPEDDKREMHLAKLNTDISEFDKGASPEYKAYLPFLWLKKQKKNLMTQNTDV